MAVSTLEADERVLRYTGWLGHPVAVVVGPPDARWCGGEVNTVAACEYWAKDPTAVGYQRTQTRGWRMVWSAVGE